MTLENKYNVPRETLKKMVDDGVISTSVIRHYEIFDKYKRLRAECSGCTVQSLIYRVSDETRVPFDLVKWIVYKLCKKN